MKKIISVVLCITLAFYPPKLNISQTVKVPYAPPTIRQQTALPTTVESEKKKTDSLNKEADKIVKERDRKLAQLIVKNDKLESENALLKQRLKIGAITKPKSTNDEKKNSVSTVQTKVKDTVIITNTETVPCPDSLLIPVRRRSLWKRIFN